MRRMESRDARGTHLLAARARRGGVVAALLAMLVLSACGNAGGTAGSAATNAPGAADAARYRLTYVAVGASDAFGIGTDDPDQQAWPTSLTQLLGDRVHLINLGIPGATVAQAQQTETPIALDAHPDIITVWLAVNDLADGVALPTYRAQLQALLASLVGGTHARVYVGNVPDLTLLPHFADRDPAALSAQVRQWNDTIAGVCAATGATLVDLYAVSQGLTSNPDYISGDGFHPSAVGALHLATIFADAILRAPQRAPAP